jgi:TonB family protein
LQLRHWRIVRDNTSTAHIPLSMAETAATAPGRLDDSPGHLSVRIEGAHPAPVRFSFEDQQKRIAPAFAVSLASHVVLVTLLVIAFRHGPARQVIEGLLPDQPNGIVWLSNPGPGGGGGGGGNEMKEPPRKAELPGKDKITVPVEEAPKLEQPKEVEKEPDPVQRLNIPAQTMADAAQALKGTLEPLPGPPTISQGAGTGGGAGTGAGVGIGPGSGSGLGPGTGGGTGGGVYRPGNGVTLPRVLREVKPQYTSDAMRAKVQGTVLLECVVNPDGTVGEVQVVRSLDRAFGLDQEAVKAARQWRFAPGLRLGEPVAVLVTIELTFTLR